MVAVGGGRPIFEGVDSEASSGYATFCVPPGVTRGALVTCGPTGRSGGGVALSRFAERYGSRMALTRLGVGVNGGTFDCLGGPLLAFLTGVSGTLNSGSSAGLDLFVFASCAGELAKRFLETLAAVVAFSDAAAMVREETLLDLRTAMLMKKRASIHSLVLSWKRASQV